MSGPQPAPTPPTSLRWTVHPAADEPVRAAALLAVVAVAGLLTQRVTGSTALGVGGGVVLLMSLRAWFLPRHYALDAEGAREDGPLCPPQRVGWGEVRQVARSRFGVYLSTLHSDSRFVRSRGLFLRTAGNASEVLAFVEGARQAT